LRGSYDEITETGAEVVAVGTGDTRYAEAFVKEERIPFPVLVDDDAEAATAASIKRVNPVTLLLDPRAFKGGRRAYRDGYRIKKSGKRVTQLGATFVVGPGSQLRYEHLDAHTADHAPLAEVLAAVRS
jgi:hypothetical protein